MKNTDKPLEFFKVEGKKLLIANPEVTPGEVRNILEAKYGKMHWKKDGSVPKRGEKGFDFKFKPMGVIPSGKNKGNKRTFQIESLEVKKNRNVTNVQNRKTSIDLQTIGEKDFPKVAKGSGLEAHHKRGLNLYRPIYEGLTDKQALSLSKWFISKGFPLGHKLANSDILPKGPHRHIHNYMGKEGYTEFKLPKFNKMSIADRKAWAVNNFLSWAKDTDRKTIDIMQKYRQQNPSKYQQLYKSILNGTKKTNKLSGIKATIQDNYTTEFTPKNGNDTNGKTNGHTNGKVTNGKSTKVPTNGKTNGLKNGSTNGRGRFISSLTKKTKNLRGLSGVALDTNFMDDLVRQKPSAIYKTPRDSFFAPIPTRDENGFLDTNFLPIDKV